MRVGRRLERNALANVQTPAAAIIAKGESEPSIERKQMQIPTLER
jgi:hypothetical protein